MRQLGYDIVADANDEYLNMSERTTLECVYLFCEYIIQLYDKIYLCNLTKSDVEKLYAAHLAQHGLPGMFGNLDCTHWKWKICPNAWRCQFTRGDHDGPRVILEGVASHDLWFWHAFFGMAGYCHDLNVLAMSPLLNDISEGKAPDIPYVVNGNEYKFSYYIGDEIYLNHATFVKAFSNPKDDKRKLFKEVQESARKYVKRAFGELNAR